MLDPFCFFASSYLQDAANHDDGDSFKKKKKEKKKDKAREILQTLTRHKKAEKTA